MFTRYLLFLLTIYATVINSQLVRMSVKKGNNMKRPESNSTLRNLDSAGMDIDNYLNSQYTGTIKVGSKGKEFKVILDTGSSNLWIPEIDGPRGFQNRYDCSSSTTCKPSRTSAYSIQYGIGAVTGYKVAERVQIGDLDIPQYNMLLVYSAQDMPGYDFDGILGLSLARHYSEFPTLLETLKRNGLIEVETFSMFLGDKPNSLGETTGEIIFGGYDPDYAASEFKFVVTYNPSRSLHWAARMRRIGYGSEGYEVNLPAIFDSGTSLLVLPEAYIQFVITQAIDKGVQIGYDEENELYLCSCNARKVLQDLVFQFDEVTLQVPADSYVIMQDGECFLGLEPAKNEITLNTPMILGDVLLKNYYVMYSASNSTVGFAKAVPTRSYPVYFEFLFVVGLVVLIGAGIYYWNKKCKYTMMPSGGSSSTGNNGFNNFKSKGIVIGSNYSNELSSQYRYNQQRSDDEAREAREVPSYPPAT